ncbi:MAG: hypothetical protein GY722_06215 [bacterium]|nr:hypothetical protein [bacterium]
MSTFPSIAYWLVCIVLLLWGLGGVTIYAAYFAETPEEFALTAETAENRDAYAEYISDIPFWAIGAGIIAAVARLLGAVSLLLRRAWALPLYTVALVCFLVALFRAFVLADVASVMSTGHIAVEVVFVALSIFAIWFARVQKRKGILH